MIRVMVNQEQLADLLRGDSSLWPILNLRLKEKLKIGDESPIFFGNVILKQLREELFTEQIEEIDLTDVPLIEEVIVASPWKRFWSVVAAMASRLKRILPSTNGA